MLPKVDIAYKLPDTCPDFFTLVRFSLKQKGVTIPKNIVGIPKRTKDETRDATFKSEKYEVVYERKDSFKKAESKINKKDAKRR